MDSKKNKATPGTSSFFVENLRLRLRSGRGGRGRQPGQGRVSVRSPAIGARASGVRDFEASAATTPFDLWQGSLKDTFCPIETWLFPPK